MPAANVKPMVEECCPALQLMRRHCAEFGRLELAITEPLEYRHSIMVHGLVALPVSRQHP
jgi:hypothetical protein